MVQKMNFNFKFFLKKDELIETVEPLKLYTEYV